MSEIDDLRKKVESLRERERRVNATAEAVRSMMPLYSQIESLIHDKVSTNRELILRSSVDEIVQGLEDFSTQDIVDKLNDLSVNVENEGSKKVVSELKRLFVQLQKLESKTYFDESAFRSIFSSGIERIANILIQDDMIPRATDYIRRSDQKITKVIETYDGFVLTHTWMYDSKGNLNRVTTKKNETS